jgi:hypothetical protein
MFDPRLESRCPDMNLVTGFGQAMSHQLAVITDPSQRWRVFTSD